MLKSQTETDFESNSERTRMKNKINTFSGMVTLISMLAIVSQIEIMASTNPGTILITARRQSDMSISRTDVDNIKGPGQITPGDLGMHLYLGDNGYASKFITVTELDAGFANPCDSHVGNPVAFLTPSVGNPALSNADVKLIITSAAGSVADNPDLSSFKIAKMTGEFGLLGTAAAGSLKIYNEGGFGNLPVTTAGQYLIVTDTNHPVMQGIPVDALGRVKVVRDAYPEEEAHVPSAGKANWEHFWVSAPVANKAPGTTILGVMANDTNQSCFAVVDTGGQLYDGTYTSNRLVHLWFGEQSSNFSRRTFNSLSDIGKVIFLRAAKWAMGETLSPYQPLGNVNVALTAPGQIQLSWTGTAAKNYKILGTADLGLPFSSWETVAQDIPGANGTVTRTLNISSAVSPAFLRVMPVP